MTEFDKAWREFTDAVVEALHIPAMLDWLAAFIDRHPWIARIPAPPKWMGLMFWIYACVGVQALAILYAYLDWTRTMTDQTSTKNKSGETLRIMYELWKRDAKPDDPAPTPEIIARREAWNMNPPCPTCGSYRHFEC